MAKYLILGAGKQGIAVAYYLSKFYNAGEIWLVDRVKGRTADVLKKLRVLVDDSKTKFFHFDGYGLDKIFDVLSIYPQPNVIVSALPHEFNLQATKYAVSADINYCDFGFDVRIVMEQIRSFNDAAERKGISIIPNCGVGPGLVNILAFGGAKETKCDTVKIYIGGNPQKPDNAWGYRKLFSGLLHEYTGTVTVLVNGSLVTKNVPSEPEHIRVGGIRNLMEAFLAQTSFGLTAGLLQEIGVKNAFEKTVRFPGHYTVIKSLQELGFFDKDPVSIMGKNISPWDFTSAIIERNLKDAQDDFLILRVICEKNGKELLHFSMLIQNDIETGFTAMQQSTASVVAAIAAMQADKKLRPGAYLPEQEVVHKKIIDELWKMNFPIISSYG